MSGTKVGKPVIVAAGYAALDSVDFDSRISHHAGGTAVNVAAILSWLGWEAHIAALIGDDPAGRRLVADLKQAHINLDHLVQQNTVQTPQVIHEIADGRHRFRFRCPECGRRFPRSRPLPDEEANTLLGDIEDAAVFFFDRANGATLMLADAFRHRGALVVFEPSVNGSAAVMQRATELAHVVKFSDDRLSVIWSELPAPKSNQAQVVTRGEHGAVARIGKTRWAESAAFDAQVIDPGGAGDWTTAGLLYELDGKTNFDGERLVESLRFGQALAALNCEWPGARGLSEHRSAKAAVSDARRLLRAAPRRAPDSSSRRRTRRHTDACPSCLAPHEMTGTHRSSKRRSRSSSPTLRT